jgi:hypothetical protein
MDYDVVEARYLGRYTVWLRFRDGAFGEIDLDCLSTTGVSWPASNSRFVNARS